MSILPMDPLANGGLAQFAIDFRNGKTSSLAATQAYLKRIESLNPKLNAYQFINADKALATAQAMDNLIQAGVDLGPLMGIPIAVKDIFNIKGYPRPNAGTLVDLTNIVDTDEGPFIQALKHSGVVILGTTKAVEFCLGITGASTPLGTPWNPYDPHQHRIPGGSSSGSAVACAAGLCAFAIGSDTGGSARVPAAFNGLFGLKTTFGRWPTSGLVPLDQSVDTIGLLSHTAADAKIAFDTIEKQLNGYKYQASHKTIQPGSLVIGRPDNIFYENLDTEVSQAIEYAESRLKQAGSAFAPFNYVEASERSQYFPLSMPIAVIAMLGEELFNKSRADMDPVVADRVATGIGVDAATFMQRQQQRQRSIQNAKHYFDQFDVIASPTTTIIAPYLSDFDNHETAMQHAMGMTQNTQPVNYLEQCAVSIPIPVAAGQQTVGYQLSAAAMNDARLLDIAIAVEKVLGPCSKPQLDLFL